MMRLQLALALAAVPAGIVMGVHHFKELNSVEDLQYLNMVAPDCESCMMVQVPCHLERARDWVEHRHFAGGSCFD
jgi:hypothetical protein